MKKMYLVLAALVIAAAGFSQAKVGFQVIGNAGNVSFKSETIQNSKKSFQVGFGAGIVADLPLAKNFSLKPSVNFLQQKNSIEFQSQGNTNKVSATLNYIQLPVDFVYTIPGKSVSAYVGAGPSVSYGVSGTMRYKGFAEVDGHVVPVDESSKAFEKEENDGAGLSRYDIGANVIAGLKFTNGLFVNAGYLGSLRNLAEEGGKYKNYSLQLTVGILL